jgi:hypothetical protein
MADSTYSLPQSADSEEWNMAAAASDDVPRLTLAQRGGARAASLPCIVPRATRGKGHAAIRAATTVSHSRPGR